jgi:hypothetical protein
MNFFHFKLDIIRKRSKIFHYFVLFFIIFLLLCTFSYSQEKSPAENIISQGKLVEEKNIGEYIYRQYKGPSYGVTVFQIYRKEELVYQSDIGYSYWLREEDEIYNLGDDITGDDISNLIVMEDSGGSFFPQSCQVFSLGEKFRLIQDLPSGYFQDLNWDGKLEYITYEIGFSYWHVSHADAPAPKIVYEYCGFNYLLAPALTYQHLPPQDEITQAVIRLKKDIIACEKEKCIYPYHCWYYEGIYIPPSVWSYMLDLIFSGHPAEAYIFLGKVWPEGKKGESQFICDFNKILDENTIWPALKPMLSWIAQVKKEDPSASLEEEITQGVIRIRAYPENTKVYVNNQILGEAPLSTDFLAPGEYNIRLSQPSYYDTEITAEVIPLHIQKVKGSLEQKVGNSTLFISSNPEKAEVFLDNTYIGVTPLKVEKVLAGGRRLAFMKPGYHLYKKTYEIYPATDREIMVELEEDKTVYMQEVIWIPLIIIFVLFLL